MSKAVIIPECNKDIVNDKDAVSLSPTDKKDGPIGLFTRLLRLDALKRNNVPEVPSNIEPQTTYYGVYIPCEIKKGPDEEALHVYKNKAEALELVKRYKTARFKAFTNQKEAISFALKGAEPLDTVDGRDSPLVGEKPYPFKAPSPQDMVALRKAMEAGLITTVRDRVWDNPRFLVSSGNTPAILQEGSRYNALHVAAKAMNAELCNLVLTTVGDPAFVQRLYGSDADPAACKEFTLILVDRYLNTPDKAMNETPLHFAAKFGADAVVEVLTSFPQCNRNAVNKFGEQPNDIICKRAANVAPETVARIRTMLQQRYYVPVLHSEDDSSPPTIGRPFQVGKSTEVPVDPLSPRYEIRAYAGPMLGDEAESFRRKWKTPPRSIALRPSTLRYREMSKRLEAVGRDLAEKMKVDWKEYWPFLDTFTDLRTPEGLNLLETYLKNKYEKACSFAYNESCAQTKHEMSFDELSMSRISLGNLTQSPFKDSTMSPMSELCVAMKTCTISSDRPPHWKKTDPIRQRLCRQPNLKLLQTNGESPPAINHTVNQLLCIERTCQVFAKRIADALIFSLTAEPEVAGESLKAEGKHLQHTMYTYMDDERFQNINFALIHSRLSQLVVYKLKQQTQDLDDVNHLLEFLAKLRCPNDDIFSSDDERKPYRGTIRPKASQVIDSHVRCLSSFICEELVESDVAKGPSISESECGEIWDKAAKCKCDWSIDLFERNSKKNASFRKNRSTLSTSPKSESFVRRLSFDHDIGDGALQGLESAAPVSVNSPGGDSAPPVQAKFTVDTAKCTVVHAEISEDDSSGKSDDEEYCTASEHSDREEMEDASDRALADAFIYGEEPTKMDRLVYDAVTDCEISSEKYPNIYRWRHTISLYTPEERSKWLPAPSADDSGSPVSLCGDSPIRLSLRPKITPLASTPCKDQDNYRDQWNVSLQMSNWLRVTGPNSPRAALASKSVQHNVSFGF